MWKGSGMDLLKGPLWTTMPLEAMLVSVVHAAAPDHSGTRETHIDICSVQLPGSLMMSLGFEAMLM